MIELPEVTSLFFVSNAYPAINITWPDIGSKGNASAHKLRIVTVFGAGLLAGAAMAIIIPEGVNTINLMPKL